MPTAREQQLLDFTSILADPSGPGEERDFNGVVIRVVPQPIEWVPASSLEGVQVERDRFFLLRDDLGFVPVPWQELIVGNRKWNVEAVPEKGAVLEIVLVRYLS